MTFNKKRLITNQSPDSDKDLVASVKTLCESTLRAQRLGNVDEFKRGCSRIQQISFNLRKFGQGLNDKGDGAVIISTPAEGADEAKNAAYIVKVLCSSFQRHVADGRTEHAEVLKPYIREIMASCSEVKLPAEG